MNLRPPLTKRITLRLRSVDLARAAAALESLGVENVKDVSKLIRNSLWALAAWREVPNMTEQEAEERLECRDLPRRGGVVIEIEEEEEDE